MNSKRIKRRRGTILVAVLVCLGAATTIVLSTVHVSIRQHRQVRQELQLEQTRWLLDAGVDKAVTNFLAQPDNYKGETLTITPPPKKYQRAAIKISLIEYDRQAERVRLRVAARIEGIGTVAAVTQRSRDILLDTKLSRQGN